MNLKELKTYFISSIKNLYPSEEVLSFFNLLADKQLGLSRIEIALQPEKEISKVEKLEFDKAISRLENFEPIQYILGDTEFFGLPFRVDNNVLIPRPETEELVDWIVDKTQNNEATIMDIGTGSGCISISLAKHLPKTKVYGLDVSADALQVAKQNAELNKVDVTFVKADVLDENSWEMIFKDVKFDTIVSNPPYVRVLEKKLMKPNVVKHEPDIALFVEDEDPLLFYRKIAQLSKIYLKPEGALYFEINEYLSKEMKEMLEFEGFKGVEIRKDIFKKDRMIKCMKNEKTR
ncbi:MAG: release factor glutamine methyltransferase [Flavobacteriaceae bacterium]